MSLLSQFLGMDAKNEAISAQQQSAKDQLSMFKDMFTSLFGGVKDQYAQSRADLNSMFDTTTGRAGQLMDQARVTGRNMAARSGLVGGSQEAAGTNRLLENISADALSQMNQAQTGLNQGMLSSLTGLAGGAMSGAQGAGSQLTNALGRGKSEGLGGVADLVSTVLSAIL